MILESPVAIPPSTHEVGAMYIASQSGEYTLGFFNPKLAGSTAFGADRLIAIPAILPAAIVTSGISLAINVNLAATNMRIGLYQNNAGNPGALVEGSGDISTATAGVKDFAWAGGNRTLGPGIYWLAMVLSSAVVQPWGHDNTFQGFSLAIMGGVPQPIFSVEKVHVYGALPDPFGATTRNLQINPPQVVFKVA